MVTAGGSTSCVTGHVRNYERVWRLDERAATVGAPSVSTPGGDMPTATTRSMATAPTLHLALDLGNTTWKLAFATSIAHAPQLRTIPARDLAKLDTEIAAAKKRFGLPADAPVVSCYEAGRDGFWIHRALTARSVRNHVVDSASIAETRRARRAKSDRLDATALVRLLLR